MVVRDVPVDSILFALARDAHEDVDVLPGVGGNVSLNIRGQTFEQILGRIGEQADLVIRRDGRRWIIAPDRPVLRHYTVDYVNMERRTRGAVSISTSIGSAGVGTESSQGAVANASSSEIENVSDSQVWKTLEQTIRQVLGESVVASGEESATSGGNPNVMINAEAGVISIRATRRQHRELDQLLENLRAGLGRQVLIEATMVEVQLDREHQTGVDWSRLASLVEGGLSIAQSVTGNSFGAGPMTTLTYASAGAGSESRFNATLRLLETFGQARVLSSPRVTALNNQMALLKVVDEKVYFEIRASRTQSTSSEPGRVDYSSNVKSVPIGVMLSVVPQIGRDRVVSLNVRPTISRITSYKKDPAGLLLGSPVDNLVPEVQVREIESTIRLDSGQTAVLGGLMQESEGQERQGVPWLMDLPLLGRLFSYQKRTRHKTELVIFLRPTVIETDAAPGAELSMSAGPSLSVSAKDNQVEPVREGGAAASAGRGGFAAPQPPRARPPGSANAPARGFAASGLDPSLLDD